MKAAVFSDLHGNSDALQYALPDMERVGDIICLGDTVGYRRNPGRAVRMVRDCSSLVLQGNHDAAACGQFDEFLQLLPPWLLRTLDDVEKLENELYEWLAALRPLGAWGDWQLVHGTFRDPLMEFLTPESAKEHLHLQTGRISLAGHTHKPLALSPGRVFFPDRDNVLLELGPGPWALNPGSLGIRSSGQSWLELDDEYARWHFI